MDRIDAGIGVGWMIDVPDDPRRVGKAVASGDQGVEVEFFRSIGSRDRAAFPAQRLARAYLSPQTRVYFRDPASGRWSMGRVRNYLVERDKSITYEVRTPNKRDLDLNETEVHVRCFGRGGDPADVLAGGAGESQLWHDARWSAVEALTRLRSASGGMSGLASSSIELVPHQVGAVSRILLDPHQRYLLADEVGLGKTIEAGAVLRQALVDDDSHRILVVAPASLLDQWREELGARFDLREGRRLRFRAYDELADEDGAETVVVDEAHRCGPDAPWHSDVDRLARGARRLLLLSATPLVGAETAFLALLRWLDGARWDGVSSDAFRDIVARSQDHGRLMLGLRPDASDFILKQRVDAARTTFPRDAVVQDLSLAYTKTSDRSARTGICADLREHIADSYRIHHRLVRARRSDLEGWEFKPRGPAAVREESEDRPDDLVLGAALEDWRRAALLAAEDGLVAEAIAAERYSALAQAIGVAGAVANLSEFPVLFPGEADLLGALAGPIGARGAEAAASFLAEIVDRQLRFLRAAAPTPKIVVFASGASDAIDVIASTVRGRIGAAFAGTPRIDPSALERFRGDPAIAVLLLERTGEEGLNLHFADAIVHADLPFSLSRMEQRIGRLDRFGRKKGPVRHVVVLPSSDEDSPWSSWLEILRSGIGVFDRPVSDIQFGLEEVEGDVRLGLFRDGTAPTRETLARVAARVASERQRLDEQYALDQLAFARDDGRQAVQLMEDAEADERDIAERLDHLLVRVSGFGRRDIDRDVFSLEWTGGTLLPVWPWRTMFEPALNRPATWRRRVSETRPDTVLLRPGANLVDTLERLLDWDDRGTAFATWRFRVGMGLQGDEHVALRLCWRISPAPIVGPTMSDEERSGLERRAESLLRPWTTVQHLSADLKPIDDAATISILKEPYRREGGDDVGRDYNLGSRPAWLDRLVDRTSFARICHEVRRAGLSRLVEEPRFQATRDAAVGRASRDVARRRRRLDAGGIPGDAARERELDAAAASAASDPVARLDSVGVFVLAGYVPRERAARP